MTPHPLPHLLWYVPYFLLTRGIRLLPHRLAGRIGASLGWLAFALPSRTRRLTLSNLEHALAERSPRERRNIARRCFAHWGCVALESISLARFDRAQLDGFFEYEGLEHLEAAQSRGRGLILAWGHYGAFEIASYGLRRHAGKLHIVAAHQSNAKMRRDVNRIRERTGNVILPRLKSGHRLLNVLRSGGTVALALDQRVRPADGILIPFLDRPAWTSPVPAYLSTISGAPVVPMVAVPLEKQTYKIIAYPPIEPNGKGEQEVLELTRRYSRCIEERIRRRPEMWLWMHPRWKRCARHRWPVAITRIRANSQLPIGKTFATLDKELLAAPRQRKLKKLVDIAFLESGRCVILEASDADLRSHAVSALGHAVVDAGYRVFFTRARDLVENLHCCESERASRLRRLDQFDLVILADLDWLVSRGDEALPVLCFLDHRSEARSVLATMGSQLRQRNARTAEEFSSLPALRSFLDRAQTLSLDP